MSHRAETQRRRVVTRVGPVAAVLAACVLAAPSGLVNAQGGKGAWVFVEARLDAGNTYAPPKDDPCFDARIGMPSTTSMVHHLEGKSGTGGCWWAPKNEYTKFGFQWTGPGSPLVPGRVVQMTMYASIEFDKLRADADTGSGGVAVLVGTGDKTSMAIAQEVGQLQIGGGKKGDSQRATSAKKDIEWKVPPGSKNARLQIMVQGIAPQTKQTYNYWYEYKEDVAVDPTPPAGPTPPVDATAGVQALFTNNNVGGGSENPPAPTTFRRR